MINDELLTYYTTQWAEYRHSSRALKFIFSYLNRTIRAADAPNHGYQIYELTWTTWRVFFLEPLETKIENAIFELIKRKNNGEIVNGQFIIDVQSSYEILGIIDRFKLSPP